jgi:hypothetical protein
MRAVVGNRKDQSVDADSVLPTLLNVSPEGGDRVWANVEKTMEREDRQRVADAEAEPSDAPTDDPTQPANPA